MKYVFQVQNAVSYFMQHMFDLRIAERMLGKWEFRYLKSTARWYSGDFANLAPLCDFLISMMGERNSALGKIHLTPMIKVCLKYLSETELNQNHIPLKQFYGEYSHL